ncbi:hypothetical protein G7054_g5043 [Neopestalotiopsis clavispora]|nr:hypothetical protein G7054_g5043 [Neopestalotiopsis clavispora]
MRMLSGALAIITALGSLVHAIPLKPAEGFNGNWSSRLSPGVVNTNSAIEIRPQDDPTFSTPTEPGQPPRDRRPFDCQLANTLQLEVLVDCAYTWEHWYQENYLYYLIHISASGQDSRGWYKGIMDNLKGECKYKSECNEKAKMARSPVCFNNYLYGKQEVAGRTLYASRPPLK